MPGLMELQVKVVSALVNKGVSIVHLGEHVAADLREKIEEITR